MIDHIGIPTRDSGAARRFHQTALEPLGIRLTKEDRDAPVLHFGTARPAFPPRAAKPIHFAFAALDRAP
ncbi:hypothetical protein [Paracoccus benzoatiresistens]|uniref:VOC family protein n=1 Tax=Paracoccus benzoatiresistens TaxID=2997341 RepID=A0ABT4J2T1_9RHOB|nr:hypothetical protein [Paracoccus sp. EF6]MCZ0961428.1 hypothetical protein [Paracoccus sp. EF6]